MKIKSVILFIVIISMVLVTLPTAYAARNSELQTVVQGNSAFGFDLYQSLKENKGNLFFSPYSISTALAMTYAGARGETEKEMAQVLHFALDQEQLHTSFSELQSKLNAIQNKGDIELSIANSLWAQEGYHFLDSFLELNKKYYGAGLRFVDFARQTELARKTINAWVEEKTNNKIKELIKQGMINNATTLVLCNAIYFKGKWLAQFDKAKTVDADFWVRPDKGVKVPMMSQKGEFKFKDFGNFKAIELPYAGGDLSMLIFLPKETDGLPKLEKELTSENVNRWIDSLMNSYEQEVDVMLPRFKTTCEFELADTLTKMGMPHAFIDTDFSGMTGKKDLSISKVIHKAYIDVNEEDTEAAAATAVVMNKGISRLLMFKADHPFVFLIRENETGSILFIGRVVNPNA